MLKSLLNFVLYGHFWIATAALAMALQTQLLLAGHWSWTALDGFIATGTLTIYALHRLVAMWLSPTTTSDERFGVMRRFKTQILWYAVVAGLGAAYFFWHLSGSTQLLLLAPSGIALAYVLPLLNGRRLRDLPYLKIFLIAIAWSWITVVTPAHVAGVSLNWPVAWMLVERCCFIFAITIPFDIRDLAMDEQAGVSTLPRHWGIAKAKQMAYLALAGMLLAVAANWCLGTYTTAATIVLLVSGLSSAALVRATRPDHPDYFFSGLLDGTMILQCLLVGAALCCG
ncbi:MAG: hypothetical protein DA408_21405 [Bacteroidetes bacterium]|nr:MAG: hypothetical protein C7N36_20130 [Bacteroidota bacterium]PTM07849.1 MAG: hypothetical protein DA408_21405 [Bacteroidota bacterium]